MCLSVKLFLYGSYYDNFYFIYRGSLRGFFGRGIRMGKSW